MPYMRDLTRLQTLAGAVASILALSPDSAAIVFCPDFAKQKSAELVDEEILKLFKAFRAAGLDVSRELQCNFRPPAGSEGKTSALPWWTRARLVVKRATEVDQCCWLRSEVARTRRWLFEGVLLATEFAN